MGTLVAYRKSFADLFAEKASCVFQSSPTPGDASGHQELEHLRSAFQTSLAKMKQNYPCYGSDHMTTRQWWRTCVHNAAFEVYGDQMNEEKFAAFFQKLYSCMGSESVYTIYDDDFLLLDWARKEGIRLGIVTNGSERYIDRLLPLFGLEGRFDFTVSAKNVGYAKPHWKIFEQAVHASGCNNPGEILHIGSNPWKDCLPAKAFGLQSVLLDRNDQYQDSAWVRKGEPSHSSLYNIKRWIQQNEMVSEQHKSTPKPKQQHQVYHGLDYSFGKSSSRSYDYQWF